MREPAIRGRSFAITAHCAVFAFSALLVGACSDPPPGRTFFDRTIEPILSQKCAGNTSGCHSVNVGDGFKFAAGNLDVTTFENIQKRRDLLTPFGPYAVPPFLIKAVGPKALKLQYAGKFLPIDVQHSGGAIIEPGSDAYYTLANWLDQGATENGLKPATPPQTGNGACSTAIPSGFDPTALAANPNYAAGYASFKTSVQPILTSHSCNAGSCHGAPQSDFYITCGSDDAQLAFNFSQAWSFVNDPVADSQILRVPLAAAAGGRGHTGGDQFPSNTDGDYKIVEAWAAAVKKLDFAAGDPVKTFFADNVQPILMQRGCAFQGCHSPQATNDFKLRSGTQGFISAVALQKNYDLLKSEFMAVEFPDARRGRAIAKNVLFDDPRTTSVGGIEHRGGSILETAGTIADPAMCGAFNAMTSSPFCTVQEWLRLERANLTAEVTSMNNGDTVPLVFVERPTGQAAGRLEFDTFQGGADLLKINLTFGAGQVLASADAGGATSLVGGCAGLTAGTADIQGPDVGPDGTRVAFAARNSASEPLSVWIVDIDGANCTRVTPAVADSNGIKVHDFDPAWSPDGKSIVFASTRGSAGATRSRKRFLPQSDLWRVNINGHAAEAASLQQMTFLSNSEISPQFMREGRVTMTTEKTSDGFYQLSGRRINWDRTDYHPLLAQRATSKYAFDGQTKDVEATKPSVDYMAATDIREGSNGDFLVIMSDVGADGAPVLRGGAGALAIFNRSIGPFEAKRAESGYLASMRVLDVGAASGKTGATTGYRAPSTLPDGTILVSYAASLQTLDWVIATISPRDGTRRTLVTGGGGKARVDAVLAYKYPARVMYDNRRQLVFGGAGNGQDTGHAILHMPDAPMVFTLLTGNLRRGRPVEEFRAAKSLVVYEEKGCPAGPCSANVNGIFESRTELGRTALAGDGSVRVRLPAGKGLVFELVDGGGNTVVKMTEEHQMGPGESISMGVSEKLFDAVCGGCHGSVSGEELDVAVTPDALTGASQSMSATADPTAVGP